MLVCCEGVQLESVLSQPTSRQALCTHPHLSRDLSLFVITTLQVDHPLCSVLFRYPTLALAVLRVFMSVCARTVSLVAIACHVMTDRGDVMLLQNPRSSPCLILYILPQLINNNHLWKSSSRVLWHALELDCQAQLFLLGRRRRLVHSRSANSTDRQELHGRLHAHC